jgi:hypothetical protein
MKAIWSVLTKYYYPRARRQLDMASIKFARRVMLRCVDDIINVLGRTGKGSMLTRDFIFREIDTHIQLRSYRNQGYKARIK